MARSPRLRLDVEAFLQRHWQRAPLLIRRALEDFVPPLDADELAGLAMEDEVESRIIEGRDDTWQLLHGPFAAAAFNREPPWTLLVQSVDQHVDAVAGLLSLVDFLPRWRVDDVMVSYATDGGSVGPHYDNYDVFLLQGSGQRRWKIGQTCDENTALLPHPDLRLLADFQQQDEYLLETGDILYLPPGVAHWGIAEGECTTFSLGFRAPRLQDIVSRYCDALLESLPAERFYTDPGIAASALPGELREQDLERVMTQLRSALASGSDRRWFGELVTEPRGDAFPDDEELAEAMAALRDGATTIHLAAGCRVAWLDDAGDVLVFANGESRTFAATVKPLLLDLLSNRRLQALRRDGAEQRAMLEYLLQTGCIYVE